MSRPGIEPVLPFPGAETLPSTIFYDSGMSRPGIEPVTSHSPERTFCQLSYRGRFDIDEIKRIMHEFKKLRIIIKLSDYNMRLTSSKNLISFILAVKGTLRRLDKIANLTDILYVLNILWIIQLSTTVKAIYCIKCQIVDDIFQESREHDQDVTGINILISVNNASPEYRLYLTSNQNSYEYQDILELQKYFFGCKFKWWSYL